MDRLLLDLRHGARTVRRNPGVAVLASIALALGIGSTTTMFSITSGILRDLPVQEPHRVMHVAVTDRNQGDEYLRIPAPDLVALREHQRSFEGLAGFEDEAFHIGDERSRAALVPGAVISANAFPMLGIRPVLGRWISEDDERAGAPRVVMLGYSLWRDRYALDPAVLGSTIRVNGAPTTIVGVMPEGFRFPRQQDLWVPLALDPTVAVSSPVERVPAYIVFGRLRDGVGIDAARAEIATIARRRAGVDPRVHEGRSLAVRPYHDEMVPADARIIFRAMLAVVSFVLLIACANVTNLLLARAVSRSREMAVRVALGASPRRLIRQLLAESLAVAIPGGLLGLLLAWAGVTVFNATLGFELSFWMRIAIDSQAFAFTSLLVLVAAIAAGLAPGLQAAQVGVGEVLKDESRGSSAFRLGRASRVLVVAEVALSCALLVVTGLMVKGVIGIATRYPGAAPKQVMTARFELRNDAYPDAAARGRFYETLHTRLSAVPGAAGTTLGAQLPGLGASRQRLEIDGARYDRPEARPRTQVVSIAPGFFDTFGARLLAGRDFTWGDRDGTSRVAIVNRQFIERHLGGGVAVGRRVRILDFEGNGEWATIVGVVPNVGTVADQDVSGSVDGVYLPLAQTGERFVAVAVRALGDPAPFAASIRDAIAALDADVPVFAEGRLDQQLLRATTGERVFGGLFTFFGVSALILAIVGLTGVLAFSVSRRTRELGIRMALGGRAGSILWLVLRGGLAQLVLGLTIGLILAALVAPQFGDALFGQNAHDWTVYASIAATLLAAGALAAIHPARRALNVEPMVALRAE